MKVPHLVSAGLSFLMILIAVFFGSNIYRANENRFITHLNEMDRISYYGIADIPALTQKAVVFTFPLILTIFILTTYILIKKPFRIVRNIAFGNMVISTIIIVLSLLVFNDPITFDFSLWGYVWITMGIILIAGNILSVFIKKST